LVNDAKEALWRLFAEHIVTPMKNIWKVIRYDDTTVSSLKSSLLLKYFVLIYSGV